MSMRCIRPGDADAVDRLLNELGAEDVTYDEVGCTLSKRAVDGYRFEHATILLGHGPGVFERAVEGLKTWKAHRLPLMKAVPSERAIRSGDSVIVTLGSSVLALAVPCRIIEVISDDHRWGFSYGTLPGHPVEGEESFVVSCSDAGDVRFEITSISRPGLPLVRLMGPIGRTAQSLATRGYQRSLRRFVETGT